MLTEKMQNALNEQITLELWSSNLYLSMAFYFKIEGYDGFAHWMKLQSDEEKDHAIQLADYIIKRGGTAKIDKVDVVPDGWGSPLAVFEHVYSHECHISEMINLLKQTAMNEKDSATENFLHAFITEQVEEEATALNIVEKVKKAGDAALLILDNQLGARQK